MVIRARRCIQGTLLPLELPPPRSQLALFLSSQSGGAQHGQGGLDLRLNRSSNETLQSLDRRQCADDLMGRF